MPIKKINNFVTIFYEREEERQIFLNLELQLKKKNFKVSYSKNLNKKADIGFYCCESKINKINSKISAVFLGGMDQGHHYWPNIWKKEKWNRFDLGFLPGNSWRRRWQESSDHIEARARYGTFEVGWPKSDHLFKKKNNIKRKVPNILYAPSFECFDKQIDVVNSVKRLGYKLLIKHWLIKKEKIYKDLWNNIIKANSKSKKIYNNIKIINPKKNFLDILKYADILITDESSVAYEALLFNIPTISVKDWKIQRHNKALTRYVNPAEITFKTNKKNIYKKIQQLQNTNKHKLEKLKLRHFSCLGKSSKIIVSILINFINNKELIHKNKYFIKPTKKIKLLNRVYFFLKSLNK